MKNSITHNYLKTIKNIIDSLDFEKIQQITDVIFEAYKDDKQIFIMGNGGSASNASHFACDLAKGTLQNQYDNNQKRIKVISLTDNIATISAYGNDLSYDEIFSQQLKNLVSKKDVVIAISASGNSSNIFRALEYANRYGAITVGLLGFKTGGKAKQIVDYDITVQDDHYGRVEDIHLMIQHIITDILTDMKKKN